MRILTLNCGSSSLKFDVLDVTPDSAVVEVATGSIDDVGGVAATEQFSYQAQKLERSVAASDHREAFRAAHALLAGAELMGGIEAVGHRVVHGGSRFDDSTLIDADVVEAVRGVSHLAPLHNRPALAVIVEAREAFGAEMPMVAAFDTSFFRDLPEAASRYALPRYLTERYSIRRYGFHGLAHGYMASRFAALRPDVQRPRLVTLQLGSGCSATATVDGKPVDTSMGYTPLEGLIMGTRSGDIDPALSLRLQSMASMSADMVEALLNNESGLLGLSGHSANMRELIEAAGRGDANCEIAVEAFCNRVSKYAGGYMALIGGADAIVFGGGIGENSREVRRRVCRAFEWAGLDFDEGLNQGVSTEDARISSRGSRVEAWVIHTDEAAVIGRETLRVLSRIG